MDHISKVARGLYHYYTAELAPQGERTIKIVGVGMLAKLVEMRGAKALAAVMADPVIGTAARVLGVVDGENIDTDILLRLIKDEANSGKISLTLGKDKWTFAGEDIDVLAKYIREA
jgi:H2-forming N5,N10-methylenetetrahydromethanopterin dehydrogenase-like enzyme